jgi:hypothetical protein
MGVVIKNFSLQVSHMSDLLPWYKIGLYYSAFSRKGQALFAEKCAAGIRHPCRAGRLPVHLPAAREFCESGASLLRKKYQAE